MANPDRNSLHNAFAVPIPIPETDVVTSSGNEHVIFPIMDPVIDHEPRERRRRALAKIDDAPFGWRHVRAIIVAGVGFFTDSYDIFAINLVVGMLGIVFWQGVASGPGKIPSSSDTAIKVSTSGGTVLGQLFFGWLADQIGRKRMYGIELMIIILATLAQALASSSTAVSITGLLVFWRVIMGIGIGGDYPLSSVITSEYVF
jgi:PHS family inorganic phosphate transporter-like MFS transporter